MTVPKEMSEGQGELRVLQVFEIMKGWAIKKGMGEKLGESSEGRLLLK
jgi:hypothetical protein